MGRRGRRHRLARRSLAGVGLSVQAESLGAGRLGAEEAMDFVRRHGVVLVSAHGNSLRGLKMHLDGLTEAEVVSLNIPTGFPLVYELGDDLSVVKCHYLPDDATAATAAEAVARQGH